MRRSTICYFVAYKVNLRLLLLSLLSANMLMDSICKSFIWISLFTIVSLLVGTILLAHKIQVQQIVFQWINTNNFRNNYTTRHCNSFHLESHNRMFAFDSQINDTIIIFFFFLLFRFYVTDEFNQFHTVATWFLLLIMHFHDDSIFVCFVGRSRIVFQVKDDKRLNKTEHRHGALRHLSFFFFFFSHSWLKFKSAFTIGPFKL